MGNLVFIVQAVQEDLVCPLLPPAGVKKELVCDCGQYGSNGGIQCGTHPEMGQLKGNLDEGIRTSAALLNQTFAKVIKGENVRVDVVCQGCGHCQRVLDDFLALKEKKNRSEFHEMFLNITFSFCSFLVKNNKLFISSFINWR